MPRNTPHVIDQSDTKWHLDRKVPISLILAICVQTAGVFWWAARVDARLNAVEEKTALSAPQGDRLTRVEVNLESIKSSLGEIKDALRPMRRP